MSSYEQKKMSARERLIVAERAVDEYFSQADYEHERYKRLLEDLHSARNEFLVLISALCPETET